MVEIGDGSLFESVARNPVIQIEQNAKGKLVFLCAFEMPPTFETCLKVSYFPSHSDTFRQKTYGLMFFFLLWTQRALPVCAHDYLMRVMTVSCLLLWPIMLCSDSTLTLFTQPSSDNS